MKERISTEDLFIPSPRKLSALVKRLPKYRRMRGVEKEQSEREGEGSAREREKGGNLTIEPKVQPTLQTVRGIETPQLESSSPSLIEERGKRC